MTPAEKPTIVFSHANSFPASTYRVLFDSLKSRGFVVKALEKFGHDAQYPVSNNWPKLVQQLADFTAPLVEKSGEKVFFVGHSLGGFLSAMTAARHPHLSRGVVLIDSPLMGGWRSSALGMMKATDLFASLSPGAVSRKRHNQWPSIDAAFAHFRHKKAFANWDQRVLLDYCTHGTVEVDGQRELAFQREVETQIYNTLPDNLERLLRRHPLPCCAAFIGGRASAEMKLVGTMLTDKICKGRSMMLDGSHLFPMEKPIATAAAIEASVRNLMA